MLSTVGWKENLELTLWKKTHWVVRRKHIQTSDFGLGLIRTLRTLNYLVACQPLQHLKDPGKSPPPTKVELSRHLQALRHFDSGPLLPPQWHFAPQSSHWGLAERNGSSLRRTPHQSSLCPQCISKTLFQNQDSSGRFVVAAVTFSNLSWPPRNQRKVDRHLFSSDISPSSSSHALEMKIESSQARPTQTIDVSLAETAQAELQPCCKSSTGLFPIGKRTLVMICLSLIKSTLWHDIIWLHVVLANTCCKL